MRKTSLNPQQKLSSRDQRVADGPRQSLRAPKELHLLVNSTLSNCHLWEGLDWSLILTNRIR